MNECEERRSCCLTSPDLTPLLEEAGQGLSLPAVGLAGTRNDFAAAEEMQTAQDESTRLQNAVTQQERSCRTNPTPDLSRKKMACLYV